MRFHPTEEQDAIIEAVRGTLNDRWLPRLRDFVEGDNDFDSDSWAALMELGMGGIMVPPEQGGIGLGLVDAALVCEAVGAVAAPVSLGAQILGAALLAKCGKKEVSEHLKEVIAGSSVLTFAWGSQWLPDSWDVRFDNGKLDGRVRFVASASAANLFLTGTAGGGLVLVRKGEEVSIEPVATSDRTRRLSTVAFDGAPAILLCEPGEQVDRLFDAALVLSAAESLGAAQHCLDISVSYAKERVQFGQPIGKFQALKHQLVELAMDVEPARALLWFAAHAYDVDLPERRRAAAIAKAHIVDRQESVARGSVAAHGGIGYTWEHELNIWFRRSLFDHAWLGTPAVHRARAASLAAW